MDLQELIDKLEEEDQVHHIIRIHLVQEVQELAIQEELEEVLGIAPELVGDIDEVLEDRDLPFLEDIQFGEFEPLVVLDGLGTGDLRPVEQCHIVVFIALSIHLWTRLWRACYKGFASEHTIILITEIRRSFQYRWLNLVFGSQKQCGIRIGSSRSRVIRVWMSYRRFPLPR